MKKLARLAALAAALAGGLLQIKVRLRVETLPAMALKVLAGSLAPAAAVVGALGAALGLLLRDPLSAVAGLLGAVATTYYTRRVTASHDGVARAFGNNWRRDLSPAQRSRMLQRRWTWWMPRDPTPRWERDVNFWVIPDTGEPLLCDVWQPPAHVEPSGLAVIYLHGSAWHLGDKDLFTRPLFRHLAAQGHVVMDVAYRLCPAVDVHGMLEDVKRAVAWQKQNAGRYGVDPERIVLAGGSAGGHLALLAAYAPHHPGLTPADLTDTDLSVRGVASFYGPTDLRGLYEHTLHTHGIPLTKLPSSDEVYANLLGGRPDDVPDLCDLASPITHVGPASPPTLLFHGDHDSWVTVENARALHRKLVSFGVPVVYVEFPQTEHVFDLVLPRVSPAAQSALYDLDRFLALMASRR